MKLKILLEISPSLLVYKVNFHHLITCSKRSLVKHVNPWADYERNSDQMSLNGDDDPTLLPMELNNFHYFDPFLTNF